MNEETARALNRINLDFYSRESEDFSRTRGRAWHGWERVVEGLSAASGRLAVLDVGCGNGRFASFLAEHFDTIDYVGLDASEPLLEIARGTLEAPHTAEFHAVDLMESLPAGLLNANFDLVVAFGVMHHLPGVDLRRRLLVDMGSVLEPSGRLAVGFWQFGGSSRFANRTLSWEEYNLTAERPISLAEIDPGDHLLMWGEGRETLRYCHYTSPEAAEALLRSAGFESYELYRADGHQGQLNLYALVSSLLFSQSS